MSTPNIPFCEKICSSGYFLFEAMLLIRCGISNELPEIILMNIHNTDAHGKIRKISICLLQKKKKKKNYLESQVYMIDSFH